ncbi:MAG: U32 family peptidase, partial [Nanoarchaeota archaeon]|nr:U32 family peptidase [Nanoarchaeota archaeon]
MSKIELLSPAGDFRSLNSAIKAGADAVYFGLKEFNMRDSAKNFSIKDLDEINKICGEKIKKYLTLNTIIFDNELKNLEKIIKKIRGKVDAVICWDLSVIELCRKYKVPFHISTQASVSNSEAAKFYKKLGAKRIILARELNLKQIKEISKIIPVEIFIHGAMCVAVSGRCFTSQFLHNKSANRGKCRHPCRKSYKIIDSEGNELKLENNKVMSAKDLCTLPFIEKLKASGISSFKIEGRNREPEYVYQVTLIYRKALDKKINKKEIQQSIKELKQVYNRDFSNGFYFKTPTADDFTNSEHGSQQKTKKFIGKVFHYWKKSGVAGIKICAGELKLGDEILVIGNSTFFRTKIKSMEIENKKIKEVKKSQEVGIALPYCRKNDEVYAVVEKTNLK